MFLAQIVTIVNKVLQKYKVLVSLVCIVFVTCVFEDQNVGNPMHVGCA
jgi:hypothetical protein